MSTSRTGPISAVQCGRDQRLSEWQCGRGILLTEAGDRRNALTISFFSEGLAERLIKPEMQRVRRKIAGDDRQGYLREVREFLAAVTEGREPASPPEDARRDLEIVLHSYESMRTGVWVKTAVELSRLRKLYSRRTLAGSGNEQRIGGP